MVAVHNTLTARLIGPNAVNGLLGRQCGATGIGGDEEEEEKQGWLHIWVY